MLSSTLLRRCPPLAAMMVSANKECAREPARFESESESESAPDWLTLVIPFSDKIPEGKKGEDHGQYAKVHTGVQAAGRRAVQKVRHHYAEVARGLGVDPGSLSGWVKQADRRLEGGVVSRYTCFNWHIE